MRCSVSFLFYFIFYLFYFYIYFFYFFAHLLGDRRRVFISHLNQAVFLHVSEQPRIPIKIPP